jgi:hypothetical protein
MAISRCPRPSNGHTAQILFRWGNGVIQFAHANEGPITIIGGKRADWEV